MEVDVATPRRVVLAHGFTQTAASWADIERRLVERMPGVDPVAVDLPGHGRAADIVTDLWGAADHLLALGGVGAYVGYSMGGRVALHAALDRPELVERLVLIGATAGIDDEAERGERGAGDDRLAAHIEQIGVETFVDEWLTNQLFAGLDATNDLRDDRCRNTRRGLASSLRTCGTGTQEPLWDRLGEISCPVLVLVGENDPKFRSIGQRLVDGLPRGRLQVVADSGHSVHLERPAATVDALVDFLT